MESSTRLGGFRALKKTPEAPYTTKVNYRKCTSSVKPPVDHIAHGVMDTPIIYASYSDLRARYTCGHGRDTYGFEF